VLEDPLLMRKPFVAAAAEMAMLNSCAELALTICDREAGACSRHAVHAVLTSLIALIAGLYERRRGAGEVRATRPQAITRDFRLLLGKEYKTLKSPADYAEALHLSAPYLNEAVGEGAQGGG
jgi:AraC family transcriptional activator of pobA